MKILVVEDERELLESIGEGLELDGYYVDLCDNGPEALAMAVVESYDLILLDLNLPGMDGLDVCAAARKIPALPARGTLKEQGAHPLGALGGTGQGGGPRRGRGRLPDQALRLRGA